MSCYHPLKAFPIGKTRKGKTDYFITDYAVQYVWKDKKGDWHKCYDKGTTSDNSQYAIEFDRVFNFVEIPCGKCVGCRLDSAQMWADRCMLELQYHDSSYFLTLTYDDEHLPIRETVSPETGEILPVNTLLKSDFQKFMKRLRQQTGDDISFYMCGEYGSLGRPHYHVICFGLHLNDLKILKQNNLGDNLYTSEFLSKVWNHGFVTIGEVNWQTCAYTARYVMKKVNGPDRAYFEACNMEPEYTSMSLKPAIGKRWYEDHRNCINFDHINIKTGDGVRMAKIPRYFEKLYERENEIGALMRSVEKENLNLKQAHDQLVHSQTTLDYLEQLAVEERNRLASVKSLSRKEVQ